MIFDWDDEKARRNLEKHRCSFPQATTLFLDPDYIILDAARAMDGEQRQKAVGLLEGRLHTAVFAMREGRRRLISARRADHSEKRSYDALHPGPV